MSRAVLFLCTGNECRSQMADGFARRLVPPEVAVFSAGTAPAGVHPLATAVMAEVGIDISNQSSKSALWRSWGADVVGMTNLPEARLAREAELCYATLALPTDWDCWRARTEEVRVADVLTVLQANVERARRILARALEVVDPSAPCACHRVLDTALLTPAEVIDGKARLRLHALLARRLRAERQPAMEVAT